MLEVENKFAIVDVVEITRRLEELGGRLGAGVPQADAYFAHPTRDFRQTDEALRIRSCGAENVITYKGPKLDAAVKVRHELELPLAAGEEQARAFAELLTLLGFRLAAVVRKVRRNAAISWQGTVVQASLDDVAGAGLFLELELLADETGLEAARQRILSLAAVLQLGPPERRSYLGMVLAAQEKE